MVSFSISLSPSLPLSRFSLFPPPMLAERSRSCHFPIVCLQSFAWISLSLRGRVPQLLFHKIILRFFSHSHLPHSVRPFRFCGINTAHVLRLGEVMVVFVVDVVVHVSSVLCACTRHSFHFPNEPIVLMRMHGDDVPTQIHAFFLLWLFLRRS